MSLPSLGRPHPSAPSVLCADLRLRFGDRRLDGLVHWPDRPADAPQPVILVLDSDRGSGLGARLCQTASAVVIDLSPTSGGRRSILSASMAVLGWAADHAEEIGAEAGRLVVAGVETGAAHAAWLAVTARDEGWPPIWRQLLFHPRFDAVFPYPPHPAGVAPATVITAARTRGRGHAIAELLRRHGIDVNECAEDRFDAAELLHPPIHEQRGTP